jgi:prepilin-type N-terminal cleavage/methylation domain-containing protein
MPRADRRWLGKGTVSVRAAGFTLIEVVISTAIVAVVFGGVITSYVQSGMRVQWSGYSLAAQSLATAVLEQAKSGVWDPAQAVPINNLTNLNLRSPSYNSSTKTYTGYSTAILDVPYSSTNFTVATNFVTVQLIYVSGVTNVQMQFVRVDTVWPFQLRQANLFFTNTVCTMVAPDNRSM